MPLFNLFEVESDFEDCDEKDLSNSFKEDSNETEEINNALEMSLKGSNSKEMARDSLFEFESDSEDFDVKDLSYSINENSNETEEIKYALEMSLKESNSKEMAKDSLLRRRLDLENNTGGLIRPNFGKGDCLLYVQRQINEFLQFETESKSIIADRISLLKITRQIQETFLQNNKMDLKEKLKLKKSLNAQIIARSISGRFLGHYSQSYVPSDVDALAFKISLQFEMFHLVTDSKGNDIPMWITNHGDPSNSRATFGIVFTEFYKYSPGHFELIEFGKGKLLFFYFFYFYKYYFNSVTKNK